MATEPGAAPIVAAYQGPAGPDALAFAVAWSRASGRLIRVVTVYPGPVPLGMGRTDAEWVAYNREEAQRLLAEARSRLPEGVAAEFSAVPSESASHGLHNVVEAAGEQALLVLGSRKTRGLRRTAPGSTAERLLHGAPGPVALVPWDYEGTPVEAIRTVAVAFVDTPDGRAALQAAAGMAGELGAALRVVTVLPDTRVAPALGEPHRFAEAQRAEFADAQAAAVSRLMAHVEASTTLLDGPVVDALADIRPGEADLLVCGSRGYGPARRVLLGGVSSRLLRHARVPVIVVPRT